MSSLDKRLLSPAFDGVEANFRVVMPLTMPQTRFWRSLFSELEEELRLSPGSAGLYAARGKVLSNLGQYDGARRSLEKAISLDGRCAQAYAWLGQVHLLQNKIDASMPLLTKALALDPAYAWARFYRAAARYVMGLITLARKDLESILRSNENGQAVIAAQAFLSLIAARGGRSKAAASRINGILKLYPQQRWLSIIRAIVYRCGGDTISAVKSLDSALSAGGQSWVYRERASLNEEIRRYREALRDIERAGRLEGGLKQPDFLWRGRLHLALKRLDLALRDLREALDQGATREARGFALQLVQKFKEKGNRKEAARILRDLSSRFPRDGEIRQTLRKIRGEVDEATRMAQRAPQKEGTKRSIERYFRKAEFFLNRGDRRAMRKALLEGKRHILSKEGAATTGLIGRFQLAVLLNDYEEAARMGEAVLDQSRQLHHLYALSIPFLPRYDGSGVSSRKTAYLFQGFLSVRRYIRRRPDSPWGYYICYKWCSALRRPGLYADIKKFLRFPVARYGWMRTPVGRFFLQEGRFHEAIRQFELARDFSCPPDWRCQCMIAEALVCAGDLSASLRAFERAKSLAGQDLGQVMAWEAEVLLWAGRYKEALRILRAIPKDAHSPYARCWEGAALSKLGRRREALEALEESVSRFPRDCEARVWKAETLLQLGRKREAEREASRALKLADKGNYFASAIRGLARLAQGDEEGLRQDYAAIPSDVIDSAQRRLKPLQSESKKKILETVLELGLGNRRMDLPLPFGFFS